MPLIVDYADGTQRRWSEYRQSIPANEADATLHGYLFEGLRPDGTWEPVPREGMGFLTACTDEMEQEMLQAEERDRRRAASNERARKANRRVHRANRRRCPCRRCLLGYGPL